MVTQCDHLESCLRTLVVDDDHDTADTLGRLIEIGGDEVRVVYDGAAAVEAAIEFRPNVGLIDLQIPQLDGFRLAKTLRDLPALHDMMLVAVTGFADTAHRTLAKESGFDEYMVKPFSLRRLRDVLRIARAIRRGSRETRAASELLYAQTERLRETSLDVCRQVSELKSKTAQMARAQRRKELEFRLADCLLQPLVGLLASHPDCRRAALSSDACWCAACIERSVQTILDGEPIDDQIVLRLLEAMRRLAKPR